MRRFLVNYWKWWLGASTLAGSFAVAGWAWAERNHLQAWYCVRGLAKASGKDRDTWVKSTTALGSAAVPALVDGFRAEGAAPCANSELCLLILAKHWGPNDARCTEIAKRLADGFPRFSSLGQRSALHFVILLGQAAKATMPPEGVTQADTSLFSQAASNEDEMLHASALTLAKYLAERLDPGVDDCRVLIQSCLKDSRVENRLETVRFALLPHVALPNLVVSALRDPNAEVRRAAMLGVGPSTESIDTDELLSWLHDPDADVRQLCAASLRGRGLHEENLQLARLITDDRPSSRLEVLGYLNRNSELDPGTWLLRLSHDQAPSVRAACVRAVAEQTVVEMTDRLQQMASDDPSPTIRQLAAYYLISRKLETSH